jgi:hypothetical protein
MLGFHRRGPYPRCMEHAYFGSLSDTSGELRWERTADLGGREVQLEMTSDTEVTPSQLDAAATFARGLAQFDAASREALVREQGDGSAVRLYIDHHLSQLPAQVLQSLFATTRASEITPVLFLARMVLQRVGLYPGDEARTAVFDYTLDEDATNYLVAVSFGADGEITAIGMES